MDKTILKTLLNRRTLILLEVLVLVGVGFFWGEQIRQFVLDKRETFLPAIEWESADLLELTAPELLEEEGALTEEISAPEETAQTEPSLQESAPPLVAQETEISPVILLEQETSFAEIEQQIREASLRIEAISKGVAELLEASDKEVVLEEPLAAAEEKTESEQLAEIASRIKEISIRVETISQELVELELVES